MFVEYLFELMQKKGTGGKSYKFIFISFAKLKSLLVNVFQSVNKRSRLIVIAQSRIYSVNYFSGFNYIFLQAKGLVKIDITKVYLFFKISFFFHVISLKDLTIPFSMH